LKTDSVKSTNTFPAD